MKKKRKQQFRLPFEESSLKSSLFGSIEYKDKESKILEYLNNEFQIVLNNADSVRTIGDLLSENLKYVLTNILDKFIVNVNYPISRKRKANIIFDGIDGMKYFIDIITHNTKTTFNMPNVTSVDILQNIYDENKNIFVVLLVDYDNTKAIRQFNKVTFLPIEYISWNSLNIGAIGIGQIQLKHPNKIQIQEFYSRKLWMDEFYERLTNFYKDESKKLNRWMVEAFENRLEWNNKKDIWKSSEVQ